ncbi:unnamed protein product [Soboliphyme baturini]|uniref:RIIa domain-containing protein n=1 Tax=Soboliphyme baturini TaxID=241478 RepID=A0A183ISW4_9BILA|nr:unnamed protein product [Soboliphyme baturini]
MEESDQQSRQARLCEEYCARYNITDLIKDAIVQLCINQPENPVSYLKDYFEALSIQQIVDFAAWLVRVRGLYASQFIIITVEWLWLFFSTCLKQPAIERRTEIAVGK